MKLEILSFNGKLFKSHSVVLINAQTLAWEITLLEHHASLITALKPSVLKVVYLDENNMKQEELFAIWGGVLEISNNSAKILIDMLVNVDELDIDHAQKAKEQALALMEKHKNSQDKVDMEKFIEAQDMLLKSLAQLKLGGLK